ncbi:hypothetical protein T06_12399 [Trichinella sp. T6]|nr:hypothetical protein T06_12399 [Trichinella sp. T6]
MLNGHCATAAEPECLLEAWKGTKDVTPAAYNCPTTRITKFPLSLNVDLRSVRSVYKLAKSEVE